MATKKVQFLKLNDINQQYLKHYCKLVKSDLPEYLQHLSYNTPY